jgi:hypothetical protein
MHVFTPATAPTSLTTIDDAVPMLAATAARDGTIDGDAISGATSALDT